MSTIVIGELVLVDQPQSIDKEAAVRGLINPDWYHRAYPDTQGVDASSHYLESGWKEGRNPNPFFDTLWFRSTYQRDDDPICPLIRYVELSKDSLLPPNPIVDCEFVMANDIAHDAFHRSVLEVLISNEDLDFVSSWFSRSYYLKVNADTLGSLHSPELHFYRHGIVEGRQFSPGCKVLFSDQKPEGAVEKSRFSSCVAQFKLNKQTVRIIRESMNPSIVAQIMEQAELDPDIVSPGHQCVPYLPQFIATDIATRDLIDIERILFEVGEQHDYVIILPRLQIGGAEKYAAMLASCIQRDLNKKVLVITTDSWSADDTAALKNPILQGFRGCHVASLHEPLKRSWRQDQILAMLVLRSQAKGIFVINSELGLRMAAGYGRAISTVARIYCAFFSESPFAVGAPYSARYLRKVLPTAHILSDNRSALGKFLSRMGPAATDRMVCLPQAVESPGDRTFEAMLKARLSKKSTCGEGKIRLLWVSRWEDFKLPQLVLSIAQARENFEIDAYGPVEGPLPESGPSNFSHKGIAPTSLKNLAAGYDVFLFTSMFEGMPNVVLEMIAEGIPVVASDVGGLRETFKEGAIELVDMRGDSDGLTQSFVRSIDKVVKLGPLKLEKRLRLARAQLLARHSATEFSKNVREILRE